MDAILENLIRGAEQLLGRAGGPLHFGLVMMPTVVTILAIRAGLRDARDGQSAFLWALLTHPTERRGLFRSGVKDIDGTRTRPDPCSHGRTSDPLQRHLRAVADSIPQ